MRSNAVTQRQKESSVYLDATLNFLKPQQQCLMWFLHLAVISMRPAEMTTKICENAPASLQVSHRKRKRSTTNFKAYATHELVNKVYQLL